MPSPTERLAIVHQTPAVRKILTSAFRLLTDADFPHRMTKDTVRNGIGKCAYQQNLYGWNGLAARGLVMALSSLQIALVGGVDEFSGRSPPRSGGDSAL